jgi:hypothetical protein
MPSRARRRRSASSRAGEYVREEIHHIRAGKHGARSTEQAIAIGLSKARRAGVKLPVPRPGTASAETRRQAAKDLRKAERHEPVSPRRSRGSLRRLRRYGDEAASTKALSAHAKKVARRKQRKSRT